MKAVRYKLQGILRQSIYKDGYYHDQYVDSLLREDYYQWKESGKYALSYFVRQVRKLINEYVKI